MTKRRTLQNGLRAIRRCFPFLAVIVAMWLALPLSSSLAQYDYFPSRPITIVIPFTPGGSADVLMRLVGQKLSESVKQPVLLDNRPGGGGNVGALAVKLAPPDGYTLFMAHTGTHAVNVTLYPDLKFDPIKDFQPITPLFLFPSILVVPATSSAKTFAEFVARAKTKPGGLSYASQGIGSSGHLLGEMFAQMQAPRWFTSPTGAWCRRSPKSDRGPGRFPVLLTDLGIRLRAGWPVARSRHHG